MLQFSRNCVFGMQTVDMKHDNEISLRGNIATATRACYVNIVWPSDSVPLLLHHMFKILMEKHYGCIECNAGGEVKQWDC